VYTPSKDNSRADTLSRQTDIIGTKKVTNYAILYIYKDRSLRLAQILNNLIITIRLEVPKEL
jgi:hypothetical protein